MDNSKAQELLDKYLTGKATPEEKLIVEHWYNQQTDLSELSQEEINFNAVEDAIYHRLPKANKKKLIWRRLTAAAAVLIVTAAGVYFYNRNLSVAEPVPIVANHDINPGSNRATLTLGNGQVYQLSNSKTGVSIYENRIAYNDGSQIAKEIVELPKSKLMNMAATPAGGTYLVVLQDGSRVWLNASSSLKFPSTFAKSKNRVVELSGEAYFEIAKNKKRPFIVNTKRQEVKVLGTHFNINSYEDEKAIKTTLLEGSVKVTKNNKKDNTLILRPGEQAILNDDGLTAHQVEPSDAVAWKNGFFVFESEPLELIMKEISRWYDVDVKFNNPTLKSIRLSGSMSKYVRLSQVIKKLELVSELKFKINGQKIIVEKKT